MTCESLNSVLPSWEPVTSRLDKVQKRLTGAVGKRVVSLQAPDTVYNIHSTHRHIRDRQMDTQREGERRQTEAERQDRQVHREHRQTPKTD